MALMNVIPNPLFQKSKTASSKTISFCTTRQQGLNETLTQLGIQGQPKIQMNQTHSNHVWVNTHPLSDDVVVPDTDAIITTQPNQICLVKTADCLPVLIAHVSGIVAAVHAGRRGTQKNILSRTLSKIIEISGSKKGFTLWFGPCISVKHYQIDPKKNLYFDIVAQNEAQLRALLSKEDTTLIKSGLCTVADNARFFSYRKNNQTSERFYSGIMMESSLIKHSLELASKTR